MGDDSRPNEYFIERMEFPNLWAVHFVIYGSSRRRASSCQLLDCLGKEFADYTEIKVFDVPERFLDVVEKIKKERRKEVEERIGEGGAVAAKL